VKVYILSLHHKIEQHIYYETERDNTPRNSTNNVIMNTGATIITTENLTSEQLEILKKTPQTEFSINFVDNVEFEIIPILEYIITDKKVKWILTTGSNWISLLVGYLRMYNINFTIEEGPEFTIITTKALSEDELNGARRIHKKEMPAAFDRDVEFRIVISENKSPRLEKIQWVIYDDRHPWVADLTKNLDLLKISYTTERTPSKNGLGGTIVTTDTLTKHQKAEIMQMIRTKFTVNFQKEIKHKVIVQPIDPFVETIPKPIPIPIDPFTLKVTRIASEIKNSDLRKIAADYANFIQKEDEEIEQLYEDFKNTDSPYANSLVLFYHRNLVDSIIVTSIDSIVSGELT
jgi:hypothetical protein